MEKLEPGVSKNLLQVLNELQGKICFVKQMTTTNVRPLDQEGRFRPSRSCQLSLPKSFSDANRMKIKSNDAVLHSCMLDRTWRLRLALYASKGEYIFSRGWRGFVTDNGILNGDILIFFLTAISEFVVYIFDSQGLPKPPPTLQPSKRSTTELKVSQRIQRVLEPLGNKREVTAEENENKSRVTRLKTKAQSDGESADLASNAARQSTLYCNARSTKAKTMEYSPARTCHCIDFSDQDQEKLEKEEADQEAPSVMLNNNKTEVSGRNLKPKIQAPPKAESSASFQKRLSNQNLTRMEVPAPFLKKHGSRIRSHVQLQGTLRGSPARDAILGFSTCRGQSRFYFHKRGWRDFVRENMLQEGQNICFTLIADSYFEVREM